MEEKIINVKVRCSKCHGEYTTPLPIPKDRPPELGGEQPCPEQWERFRNEQLETQEMLDVLQGTESAELSICPICGEHPDPWEELSRQFRDWKDSQKPK